MTAATATRSKTTPKGPTAPTAQADPIPKVATAEIKEVLVVAAVIPPARKVEQLGPARLSGAEFVRNQHIADAAPGTQPQDLEEPTFWAHVAVKLKARDRVEVWTDDNAWIAECVVLAASRTDAIVKVLGVWELNGHQVALDRKDTALKAYRVDFRGHFEKWGVIRKADNVVVHTQAATEGAAYTWLKERLNAGI